MWRGNVPLAPRFRPVPRASIAIPRTRLETLALAWPDDGTWVNAAAIYAVVGK
jgi:hypothetical protein